SYQHIAVITLHSLRFLYYSSGIVRGGYYPLCTELMSYYTLVELPCLPCPELVLIETGNSSYKWNIHFNSNETRSPILITSKSQIGFPRYISKVKKVLIFW